MVATGDFRDFFSKTTIFYGVTYKNEHVYFVNISTVNHQEILTTS